MATTDEPTLGSTDLDQELGTLEIESDINTATASTTASTSTRRKRSNIHNHTRPLGPNEPERGHRGQLLYYCRYCNTRSEGTSGLRYHLKSKHSIISESAGQSRTQEELDTVSTLYARLATKNSIEAEKINDEVLTRILDRKVVERTLLDLIICRKLPLSIVEWPEFRVFCSSLNPKSTLLIPASHNTISKKIHEIFPGAKDHIRKVLQSAKTNIHLAVDIWTSPNRYLLLAVCGSFIDANDHFWNILLGLPQTFGHSGEVQWEALQPVLQEYGIVEKIGTVVGDNSGTNDTLCQAISHFLSSEKRIDWNATQQRIRCLGHIFNLVVQAFLFKDKTDEERLDSLDKKESESGLDEKELKEREIFMRNQMGVLGKLHTIVVYIRASSLRTQEFTKEAGRMIPLDNSTRWNSWNTMINVALEKDVRSALQQYIEKRHVEGSFDKKDILSTEDWVHLRRIATFLEVFQGATLDLQGTQPTLSNVLENFDILFHHFKTCLIDKAYKPFYARIQRSFDKFQDYQKKLDTSPYYAAARILHPERRTTWLFDNKGVPKIHDAEKTLWKVRAL